MANTRLQVRLLPDGKRLHIHDGPIDLILHADASERLRQRAFNAATNRMETILDELCVELPLLRGCVDLEAAGMIARSMQAAVRPYVNDAFITPMAAVAGAVADEVLKAMLKSAELERAFVNNGGDVALHVGRLAYADR